MESVSSYHLITKCHWRSFFHSCPCPQCLHVPDPTLLLKKRELGKVELPAVTEVAGLLLAVIPGKTSEERPAGATGGRHVAKPRAVGALPIDQRGLRQERGENPS